MMPDLEAGELTDLERNLRDEVQELVRRGIVRPSEIKTAICSRRGPVPPGVLRRAVNSILLPVQRSTVGRKGGRQKPVSLRRKKRRKARRAAEGSPLGNRVCPDITTKIARSEWRKKLRGRWHTQCLWCGYWVPDRTRKKHDEECGWLLRRARNPEQFQVEWTGGLWESKR